MAASSFVSTKGHWTDVYDRKIKDRKIGPGALRWCFDARRAELPIFLSNIFLSIRPCPTNCRLHPRPTKRDENRLQALLFADSFKSSLRPPRYCESPVEDS